MVDATPTALPAAPPPRRIAICGFTSSQTEAPWGNPEWEIWICNNLWKFAPDSWHRLYDLHQNAEIVTDTEHDAFLSGKTQKHQGGADVALGTRPLYVFEPKPEWPAALEFPKAGIVDGGDRYFTNSISWMIAHGLKEIEAASIEFAAAKMFEVEAVVQDQAYHEMVKPGLVEALMADYRGQCAINIYGVDMATGTEYAAQRPSCEYWIGIARGRGITVEIPLSSDLLKVNQMYGAEDDSAFHAKVVERVTELRQRGTQLEQAIAAQQAQLYRVQGAMEATKYFQDVWCNPRANRDGSAKGSATAAPAAAQPEAASPNGKVAEPEKALEAV